MKNLIRQILKEETNDDDKVSKGISIAINMLKKIYPFVVGWEYADSVKEYKFTIYINIKVDYQKSMEFYGLKPKEKFVEYLSYVINERQKFAYPFSGMDYGDKDGFDVRNENSIFDGEIMDIYDNMIPDHLKMVNDIYREYGPTGSTDYKQIKIDSYIFVE
jgi:hypothetical protein